VHEFDAGKRYRRRPEGLAPQHRPDQPLDGSMILFDDVVEIFDLTNPDARFSFGIVAFECRRGGTTLVDRDLLRRAAPLDRLAQEPQGRLAIPFCGQQEIYRGTGLVDGPIQVLPAALNPHVSLVHAPAVTYQVFARSKLPIQ
jgi:hypothetical protein